MKRRYAFVATLTCLVLTSFMILPKPILAAVTTVDFASDLIAAINDANVNPDPDTIILTGNILLTVVNEIDPAYGDTGLPAITSDITIKGRGYEIARDANVPNFRIFRVAVGATLTLENVTLRKGASTIPSLPPMGTLCDVECGGAVFNEGTLNITNSIFLQNVAVHGGALYSTGTLNMINSQVIKINSQVITLNDINRATQGGGLYMGAGTATITNSTFNGNGAFSEGGGAYINAGDIHIVDSIFSDNGARSDGTDNTGDGGGLYVVTQATATVDRTTFTGNLADHFGGGLWGSATISNSTFTTNTAIQGGGIFAGTTNLDISNSTFASNAATTNGGGIYSANPLSITIKNVTFKGNTAAAQGGSGLSLTNATASLQNSIIVQSGTGDNCSITGGTFTADTTDLADDATCTSFTDLTNPPLNLNSSALADNGGNTKTVAITDPSPAVDSAIGCSTFDQRGVTHGVDSVGGVDLPQVGDCDIGAYEVGGPIRTMQFGSTATLVPVGTAISTYHIPITLDAPLAGGDTIKAYVWVSGGTAVADEQYVPFGVQTLSITSGQTSASVDITLLLNSGLTTDKTIILSFATQYGPGFSGPAKLGTALTHTITLKSSPAGVAPIRNYFTISQPTVTWNHVTGANRYEVEYASNSTFTTDLSLNLVGNVVSFQLPVPLDNGTYYWRVRACTGAAETTCGGWSAYDTLIVFVE